MTYVPLSSLDDMRHSQGSRLVDVASFPGLCSQPSLLVTLYCALHKYVVSWELDVIRRASEQTLMSPNLSERRLASRAIGIVSNTVHIESNAFQWLSKTHDMLSLTAPKLGVTT